MDENYKGLEDDQLTDGGAYVREYGWGGRYLISYLFKGLCTDMFNHPVGRKFPIIAE